MEDTDSFRRRRRSFHHIGRDHLFLLTLVLLLARINSGANAFSLQEIHSFLTPWSSQTQSSLTSRTAIRTSRAMTPSQAYNFLRDSMKLSIDNNNNNNGTKTAMNKNDDDNFLANLSGHNLLHGTTKMMTSLVVTAAISAAFMFASMNMNPVWAENELSDIYGGKGIDTSLVDQTCLINQCSNQATACLADDPDCRKGLTCTAKCLGDNACITGCMARYGNNHLDSLLKCTIEDNECIKIAILDGGADKYGTEPKSPSPTIQNFNLRSMEGSWYKVIGMNPNYDCYACQRNSFAIQHTDNIWKPTNTLQMDVEFSMPRLLPDGSPLPPSYGVRETVVVNNNNDITMPSADDDHTSFRDLLGAKSIALNAYNTHETMIFDNIAPSNPVEQLLVLKNHDTNQDMTFARTAHSEGEMFGLKFWENWYVIGENDPGDKEEFKFVYYNGKTRQNTYEGAFVYSRTKDLSVESMKKVYTIAQNAGMNPDQFCKIRNGCFREPNNIDITAADEEKGAPSNPIFRGILASTKISQLLGVEPVAARDTVRYRGIPTAEVLMPPATTTATPLHRPWWYEVGDYLENPRRHFQAMDSLRQPMMWPDDVSGTSD